MSFSVKTEHPVAVTSPDHLHPWGTKHDNSTSIPFVKEVVDYFGTGLNILDVGCSGGQMVVDFLKAGVTKAVGLEGSDYSQKHGRANWPEYGGTNLFTCDVTRPFEISYNEQGPHRFDVITAWEVMEHFSPEELPRVFENFTKHLTPGGLLVFSVSTNSDRPGGVELHRTRWHPRDWHKFGAKYEFDPYGDVLNDQHYHYYFKYRVRGRTGARGSHWTSMIYRPAP